MKKILLLVAVSLVVSLGASAQCTPDLTNTHIGILPDSATNLPHAVVGIPYSTVMQVYVPVDTVSGSIICDYDYVRIQTFNAPPGYTYACNPSNCSFPGNSHGCLLLTGPAPLASEVGNVYPIHVVVEYTLHIHNFPTLYCAQNATTNIDYYHVVVDAASGIESISQINFNVWQNKPNPFSRYSTIEFSSPTSENYTFKITDILGKLVFNKTIAALPGINKINLTAKDLGSKDLDSGVYLYSVGNSKTTITKRMVIEND